MLLKNKNAVIFGGAGAIGSAVAKTFAKEGSNVFLCGRTRHALDAVAKEIREQGNNAFTSVLDVTAKDEVEYFLNEIINTHGTIDICFNAIGLADVQGKPLEEMSCEDFVLPVQKALISYFTISTSVIKFMRKQHSGVIMAITANAAKQPYENIGGFGVACAAIESFCRQLAFENGKDNIRVVCLRSAGSPDAPGVHDVFAKHAVNAGVSLAAFEKQFASKTMLKRLPSLKDVANAAVLMASDKADAITATVLNVTCGELAD